MFAAFVNGALGYGFSSLTVPIALVFYAGRILNPAVVLIEVFINLPCPVHQSRQCCGRMAKGTPHPHRADARHRRRSLSSGRRLIPTGPSSSLTRSFCPHSWSRQRAGAGRSGRNACSACPSAWGWAGCIPSRRSQARRWRSCSANQGLVKNEFRAGLALIRVAESSLTAIVYFHLGLFVAESTQPPVVIVPSVLIGIPLGAYAIRHLDAETFRRICMSFDAWVVGFGLSRVLVDLKLMASPWAYSVMAITILIDTYLLFIFFRRRRAPSL